MMSLDNPISAVSKLMCRPDEGLGEEETQSRLHHIFCYSTLTPISSAVHLTATHQPEDLVFKRRRFQARGVARLQVSVA